MGRSGRRWRALLAAGVLATVVGGLPARAQEAPPTSAPPATPAPPFAVTGPVAPDAGRLDRPLTAASEDLRARGYVEEEVFLEGTASAYDPANRWGDDGRWDVRPVREVPYRTRLLVRRPADPDDFNGTVLVSWLNVGGAFDLDLEWAQVGEELLREGAAFVGVSAQSLGVDGPLGARRWDPERYGSLTQPDDALAYDIFTHAGRAIREPGAVDPLGGLPGARHLIASGHSQAAQRLVTYINAFHPTAQVYDGFLLVSRFRGAAPLGTVLLPPRGVLDPDDAGPDDPFLPDPLVALLSGPPRAQIRADVEEPVFVVLTETEAVQNTGVGRPDTDRFRTWEIAGAAHLDTTLTAAIRARLERDFPRVPLRQLDCPQPNDLPTRYALRAAVRSMAEWVADGEPPPTASRLSRDDEGRIRRDADGNALGGLRLPDLNVPTATHSGLSDRDGYCGLTGSTVPFSEAELAERYPTEEGYAQALSAAVDDAVDAGYLLPEDAEGIVASAPERFVSAQAQAQAAAAGTSGGSSGQGAPAAGQTSGGAAVPEVPGEATTGEAGGRASAPEAAPEEDRGWMATTGRDLLTPVLIGLLLVVNGRVVLTVARQRRRGPGSG